MGLNKQAAEAKLDALWERGDIPVLPLKNEKYVILSDLHLGDGGSADDFVANEAVVLSALNHYCRNGYKLILLGDVEEFWQFDLEQIIDRYDRTIYRAIRNFGDDRVFRVFGNHDAEWGHVCDPVKNAQPEIRLADEAIKLQSTEGDVCLFLVHGHQGSNLSDKSSWVSRFFVRLFKSVKPAAKVTRIYSHTSATKSQITDDYEKVLYQWAKSREVMLVCGHTHRAIFASTSYGQHLRSKIRALRRELQEFKPANPKAEAEKVRRLRKLEAALSEEKARSRDIVKFEPTGEAIPCYFNSGCTLYTDGITALEIENDDIRLIKWHQDPGEEEGELFRVYGNGKISQYYRQIMNSRAATPIAM